MDVGENAYAEHGGPFKCLIRVQEARGKKQEARK